MVALGEDAVSYERGTRVDTRIREDTTKYLRNLDTRFSDTKVYEPYIIIPETRTWKHKCIRKFDAWYPLLLLYSRYRS